MTAYIIYFNQQWVPDYPVEDFDDIARDSHALVDRMQEAGIVRFAGGLEETPPRAHADATSGELVIADGPYSRPDEWVGGFTIIEVDTEREARYWTGAIAEACRWPQELRAFTDGWTKG
ncbi:YciI family protein [Nocardioides sp. CFH 31398]|uniref:YciI family protein n=1 Tax=Nocardioides sp. CFH 31398 TaxID=2919579 RepID=UPI001F06719D|nr:YciI family protein [Nocardioides sp. CFH 31398]MCH1865068.1 YciI family protein [Nocardioides sp. CFH 31398]